MYLETYVLRLSLILTKQRFNKIFLRQDLVTILKS